MASRRLAHKLFFLANCMPAAKRQAVAAAIKGTDAGGAGKAAEYCSLRSSGHQHQRWPHNKARTMASAAQELSHEEMGGCKDLLERGGGRRGFLFRGRRHSSSVAFDEWVKVRAGMEMAVVDAVASSLKLPLWKVFGGHSSSIITDITIPIGPPEEAEELAAKCMARGFVTIKTKVGGRALSSDIALLKAIRSRHPSCSLIMDANCGYTTNEALQVLQELHDVGLTPTLFEHPVDRDDWTGLGYVSRVARDLYGLPVAADESCRSLSDDAKQIVERGLAEGINVKLAKMAWEYWKRLSL